MKKKILQSLAIGIFLAGMCQSIASIPVNLPELSEEKPIEIESSETEIISIPQTETVTETDIKTETAIEYETEKEVKTVTTGSETATEARAKSETVTENKTEIETETKTQATDKEDSKTQKSTSDNAKNANTDTGTKTETVEAPKQIYKYCPTAINGTILYCSNESNPGEVKDGIYLGGTKVLSATDGSWDSAQVCDPSVVSGNFTFNGCSYTYLMAYLGCTTYDSTNNEIGFAVSNDLYSWVKAGKIVSCAGDGFWGVGQPSVMNINGDGNIYLFYTSGTEAKTTTYVQSLNCSDLNNIVLQGTAEITTAYDFISNADFAYNPADGYLYMTCDTHPFGGTSLNFISDKQTIYKAAWDKTFDSLGSLDWQIETTIGIEKTGYTKNHNACFSRDGYGNLFSRTIYTSIASEVGDFMQNLCTYNYMPIGF